MQSMKVTLSTGRIAIGRTCRRCKYYTGDGCSQPVRVKYHMAFDADKPCGMYRVKQRLVEEFWG